ncbi:MAG: hypothetical protein HY400_03340 [Elusimicrobia bacterium]|nr:hypothetical protein [Elusimicrobiota bacterium]
MLPALILLLLNTTHAQFQPQTTPGVLTTPSPPNNIYTAYNQYNQTHYDIVLSKLFLNGDMLWNRTYDHGYNRNDLVNAITKDQDGNVYLAGSTDQQNRSDFLLVSFSPTGSLRWVQTFDQTEQDILITATLDRKSGIYVLGNSTLNNRPFLWIAKYNTMGNRQWYTTYSSGYNDYAKSLSVDSASNLIVTFETAQEQYSGRFLTTQTITYNTYGQRIR